MNEELFRNKLMISSPTSISLGHITWFALDTKLVGRVKTLLEERDNLQFKIDKAIEYLYEHSQYNDGDGVHYIKEDEYCVDYLLDILKEEK